MEKKNQFKVGCNFDFNLIAKCAELNDKYGDRGIINEYYGSDRAHAKLSARPEFRLQDISEIDLAEFIKISKIENINFNYLMNSIIPGTKKEIEEMKPKLIDWVHKLEDIGVYRLTVANPIILPIIREASKTIKIELSTIMHIDAITQIKYYKDQYDIDKVCGNIIKNRSFKFLKNAADFCNNNDIMYEILANEFCGNGGSNYLAPCVYRDSCYICHGTNHTKEDAELLNGYPMNMCMASRDDMPPMNWLRTRFVRPEDIKEYNKIGIYNWKISGRTGSTEYITKVAKAYISENFDDNLLGLWKPLETIYSGESENSFKHQVNIPNKKLNGFINHWAKNLDFDCANEVCGTTCNYCEKFADKIK